MIGPSLPFSASLPSPQSCSFPCRRLFSGGADVWRSNVAMQVYMPESPLPTGKMVNWGHCLDADDGVAHTSTEKLQDIWKWSVSNGINRSIVLDFLGQLGSAPITMRPQMTKNVNDPLFSVCREGVMGGGGLVGTVPLKIRCPLLALCYYFITSITGWLTLKCFWRRFPCQPIYTDFEKGVRRE